MKVKEENVDSEDLILETENPNSIYSGDDFVEQNIGLSTPELEKLSTPELETLSTNEIEKLSTTELGKVSIPELEKLLAIEEKLLTIKLEKMSTVSFNTNKIDKTNDTFKQSIFISQNFSDSYFKFHALFRAIIRLLISLIFDKCPDRVMTSITTKPNILQKTLFHRFCPKFIKV